jgi:hypothetical protein
MAFDAALAIRIGSGGMFALLGLVVLAVGWKRPGPMALGGFLALFGFGAMWNNLWADYGPVWASVDVPVSILEGIFAVAVGVLVPRPSRPLGWRPLLLGLAVGIASLVGLAVIGEQGGLVAAYGIQGTPPGIVPWVFLDNVVFTVGSITMVATASVRAALDPPTDRSGWVRSAAVALFFGAYMMWLAPTWLIAPRSLWSLAFVLVLVAGTCIPWLVAAARGRSRFALAVALIWPALAFLSMMYRLVPDNGLEVANDRFGVFGLMRIGGWLVLVYAILTADLLGVPLPRVAVKRGTVAAGALAVLFIVAQLAQNFFSAKYGLYLGGIIAGTFLFAANPIQRRIEGLGHAAAGKAKADAGIPERAAIAYKAALRAAMRDGKLTRREEGHLAEVAVALGLDPMQVLRLREEVEGGRP